MDAIPQSTLLLQGPVGPFFGGLARELQRRGDSVRQVCFNGGDRFFAAPGTALSYTGTAEEWPAWLERVLVELQVDRVILFGDCRPLHRAAIARCRERRIPVWVFEEGYLRPHYLTLERGGVNANSRMPRDPDSIRLLPRPTQLPAPVGYRFTMLRRVVTCIAYYLALAARRGKYRHYVHHRRTDLVPEGWAWIRSLWRRYQYAFQERGELARILRLARTRPVFLFPLQVSGDSQITQHSRFATPRDSIDEVVASFARHAPADAILVVKHHPMDRGYTDYRDHLGALAATHALGDRLVYLHDQSLPSLFPCLRGVVTVNSTVGLSALVHDLPVICLGRANYDIPRITHGGGLQTFWTAPQAPDRNLFARFRAYLLRTTQLNACSASAFSTWDLLDRLPEFAELAAVPEAMRPAPRRVPRIGPPTTTSFHFNQSPGR